MNKFDELLDPGFLYLPCLFCLVTLSEVQVIELAFQELFWNSS